MMTFVLAAAVLVGALCLAVALDGATTKRHRVLSRTSWLQDCSRRITRYRSL